MDLIAASPLWVLARATGVVLLVLLTLVLSLGVATSAGLRLARVPRFAVQLLHRDAALLALALLVVHVGTVVADGYVDVGPLAALVPFTSGYAPVWVGLGALALDLLLALVVTSLLRARLGQRAWRAVHLLAYATWPLAVVHGLGAGTDGTSPWLLGLDAACAALLLAALGVRTATRAARRAEADATAPRRPLTPAGAPR
ncbi:ferric reductase-like transmembrane domain-containing protein [uncultured Pseudokineococcus sp.]|uniref:ferric reductase-like transmembrane domain-containing protein n=1 Tax=uncultured Pseudokineococcus sp. TaxID=1642928 RepID=UPI002607B068|nr:ferric reductase-like transmembrane domain-containing protein [uncultured Pseudokineococcus sp.]